MKISKLALALLLLVGVASAFSVTDWESLIGSQLGSVFGSGQYCFGGTGGAGCPGGVLVDIGSIIMGMIVLAFFFIWSSASGIAWDGIFFLMMIVIVELGNGFLGATAASIFNLVFAVVTMAILYRTIIRRG